MSLTDTAWWQRVTAPVRRLRWRAASWSSTPDRDFHDQLFGAQAHDAFARSYPGYLTIRRFADHAERCLDGVQSVVDLGCGPGEITCELARRRPDVAFLGIDHSEVALARARLNAARLSLSNITFVAGDVERYEPDVPIDLVMMFDAFHHVLDPHAFLSRIGRHTSKVFLIEPAGTWLGQWDHRADLDWLSATVRQIGERLEHQFGNAAFDTSPADTPAPEVSHPSTRGAPAAQEAEPTEHRYTPTDFESFFRGHAIDIRGTMAGLEHYGPDPYAASRRRERFGEIAYDLAVALEDLLHQQGLDLALKHWAIVATRSDSPGLSASVRDRMARVRAAVGPAPLLPAYGVEYAAWSGPAEVAPGEAFQATLRLTNTGWLPWDSRSDRPVMVSYHWLDAGGRTLVQDGLRTPFARLVGPGESIEAVVRAQAPANAEGPHVLVIDLVQEGAAWFSDEGVAPVRQSVRIRAR